jgi:hypothetical protein
MVGPVARVFRMFVQGKNEADCRLEEVTSGFACCKYLNLRFAASYHERRQRLSCDRNLSCVASKLWNGSRSLADAYGSGSHRELRANRNCRNNGKVLGISCDSF